ncbi:OmpA family protein [Acinetobacter haemolyticus]|uniref:OmpA family protein n=2 Tax=Moraxellaceae TaxID=468 RepID=A0A5P1URI1_9GAMM|nr:MULTISPECIES: OmpA family protein [Acinetobacter]AZN68419.1 OmpA family protein [Acinetobacter haemolyticus]NAR16893.1 OmpA family protein [Acinetobacter haemolyticus]NAR28627.1 OmpA family protein [Acinetobacter haemolyticus]NAR35049.1 OmpA family protein [Acinetobacter haemolyticus]NAR46168.1 OmpA family protein [Acinetobacter haemolyticus]
MRNNRKVLLSTFIMACCGLVQSHTVLAAPIVVEGVVPNESSKQAILVKMQSVYGADQVVDKIQVRPVSAPNGWSDSVTRVITPDLKKVKQGQLRVRGTQIELTGKMSNPNEIQPTASNFQSLVQQPYRFNAQLSVNLAEQKVIDDALKDRIIEFESGSAILTETGKRILDEMAVALNKVGGKQVKIIGHTDSSGDASRNVILSKERAVAVQDYLVSKNIATDRLSTEGKGSSEPIADNATADGRRKNRRIEFEVL